MSSDDVSGGVSDGVSGTLGGSDVAAGSTSLPPPLPTLAAPSRAVARLAPLSVPVTPAPVTASNSPSQVSAMAGATDASAGRVSRLRTFLHAPRTMLTTLSPSARIIAIAYLTPTMLGTVTLCAAYAGIIVPTMSALPLALRRAAPKLALAVWATVVWRGSIALRQRAAFSAAGAPN